MSNEMRRLMETTKDINDLRTSKELDEDNLRFSPGGKSSGALALNMLRDLLKLEQMAKEVELDLNAQHPNSIESARELIKSIKNVTDKYNEKY